MARPNLAYLRNVIVFLVGLPCGALTGLTAIGSSVVLTPAARYLLGLRPARASGTALTATFFTALAGLLTYQQHHAILWTLALVLAFGQIVGAAWGYRVVSALPSLARLSLLWGVLVVAGGLAMVYASQTFPLGAGVSRPDAGFWLIAFVVSALVGLVSRVIELGGVLLVPASVFLLHLPPQVAQGTALVVLLLAALPSMLIYAQRGNLEPRSAAWLSFGGILGGLVGAYYAFTVHPGALLIAFGLAMTGLGLMLLWRKNTPEPVAETPPSA